MKPSKELFFSKFGAILTVVASDVHFWMWHIPSMSEPLAAKLLPTLTQAEQSLYCTIKSLRRQREYLAGHHLLRVALGQLLPDWADHHHFHMDEEHWLALVGPLAETIDFNLSHSGDWVACAVGRDCRVGVDIESPRRPHAYRALAAEYFSERECKRLAALPDQACREAFYELWTLKESYLKARKLGISTVGLTTEFVPLNDASPEWYCYRFEVSHQIPQQQAFQQQAFQQQAFQQQVLQPQTFQQRQVKVFGALTISAPLSALLTVREYSLDSPASQPLGVTPKEPLTPGQ